MKKIIFLILILSIPTLVWADLVILHPNANGDMQEFTPSPNTTNHYLLVDELDANSPEGTDSTVYKTTSALEEVYEEDEALDNFNASFVTIDSVVVYVRAKRGSTSPGTCNIKLGSGSFFEAGIFTPTTSYVLYRFKPSSQTYFNSDAELDAMWIGVTVDDGGTASGTLTITQMEVYVYYTSLNLNQTKSIIDTTTTSFKVRDSVYTTYSATADSIVLRTNTVNNISTSTREDKGSGVNVDTLQATGKYKNTKYYFWLIAWDSTAGVARKADTTVVDSITTKTPVSILYPSASGTYSSWLQSPASTYPFDKVDDTHGAYDTNTYIYDTTTSSTLKHSFNLQNCNLSTDSIPDVNNNIDSVVEHLTAKIIGTGEQSGGINGLWLQGSQESTWYKEVFPTYPIQTSKNYQNKRTLAPDGGYWNKAKLNSLEIGVQNYTSPYVLVVTAMHTHIYLADYKISGKVKDEDSTGVASCTLTVTGSYTATFVTDDTGYYSIGVHSHDTLTFTPKLNDWTFIPSSKTYSNVTVDSINQNFVINPSSPWALSDYMYRKKITFGTDHDTIPEGYTFELPMSTGRHKRIASNGAFNESIGGLGSIVKQSNGNLWCAYHAMNDSTSTGEAWIVKYTFSTKTWGTPYMICNTSPEGSYDNHNTPSVFCDITDTLHIVYGCHTGQLLYRKSINVDPADSNDWIAEQSPSGATYATYPRFAQANDIYKTLFIFFRYGDLNLPNKNGYIKSINNGNTWSAFDTIWKFTTIYKASAYCPGVIIKNNIIYYSSTPLTGYQEPGLNLARGVGFIKGEIDSTTGNITWKKVDGTSVTPPVDFDTTDNILFPVISYSAPWCGTNGQQTDVNSQGYPYILNHCNPASQRDEVDALMVYWDGSGWQIEDVSTSVTPNRKAWNGNLISSLNINDQDGNIYFYTGSRPATYTDTALAGTDSTITLDTNASSIDDIYNNDNCFIRIKEGTGIGQTRQVIDYTGSSRILKVSPNWTTNPDNTSIVVVSPKQYGAELMQFKFNGSNWSYTQQTDNSSLGVGGSSSCDKIQDNTLIAVFGRGNDVVYRYLDPSFSDPYASNMDGSDIRIAYQGKEIDRIIDFSNFEDSKIYFKCKNQIDEDKSFDQKGNYYVYYGNIYANTPPCDQDSVYQGFFNFELYDDQQTINGVDGFVANTAKVIASEDVGETNRNITSGNKSLKAMKGQITKSLGTNLTKYKLTGYVYEYTTPNVDKFYFGVKNNASRFLVGANQLDENFSYYDGSWHDIFSIPHADETQKKYTIIVNDSGCTGYINDKLAVSNNAVFTVFDSLCLGGGSVQYGDMAVYYDYIKLERWLNKKPNETLGSLERKIGTVVANIRRRLED